MNKNLCFMLCLLMVFSLFTACSIKPIPSDNEKTIDESKTDVKTIEDNSQFAFRLFKQLNKEDQDQNIFISPLSISLALTMAYQGSATTTKDAIAKALEYSGIDDEKLNHHYKNLLDHLKQMDEKIEMNIGNSIWIRKGEKINDDFLSRNNKVFNASVNMLDFSKKDATDQINQWISNATKKKIEKMIDPPIPKDIIMYLINAIYFKGEWTKQFNKENTSDAQFHAGDGNTNEVMMMKQNGETEYGQSDGFKAVRLPYGNGKAAMYCILPDETVPINDFIEGFDATSWKAIKDSISKKDDVFLQLPRFKIEYGIKELRDSLTALGMGEAFTEKADFSGIREDVFISGVRHKAVIEVNEKGSEAAAVTEVAAAAGAAVEPLTFVAERPFIFIIADDETGTVLFMGKLFHVK